jgi:hypothetical protein
MRRVATVGVALVALLAAAAAQVGTAAAVPAGGPIGLFATVGSGPSGKILFAGAIGDSGTVRDVDKNGKPDDNGNFVKVMLKKGTFEIDATALNKKTANPRPQIASYATCSVVFSGSAPVRFFNGTGLYKGISGTANVTLTFAGLGARYQSGAKRGQCERGNSEKPLAQIGSVIGRGTVRFTP